MVLEDTKGKTVHHKPPDFNSVWTSSQLSCERYCYLIAQGIEGDFVESAVLDEGRLHEDDVIAKLQVKGVIVTDRQVTLRHPTLPLIGHPDGRVYIPPDMSSGILVPGTRYLLDVKCVSLGTQILKADLTWVNAGDLREGDKVVGFDENPDGGRRRLRESTVVSNNIEIMPALDTVLSDGSVLRSSSSHYWLTSRLSGEAERIVPPFWEKTSELSSGFIPKRDRFDWEASSYYLPKYFSVWEEDFSYEAGYLSASWDGEGSLFYSPSRPCWQLEFSQSENEMLERVKAYLDEKEFNYRTNDRITSSGKVNVLVTLQGGFAEITRFLGQFRPPRLLSKFHWEKQPFLQMKSLPEVEDVVDVGEKSLCVLQTTTGTFIAEGFASHNSFDRSFHQKAIKDFVGNFPHLYRQLQSYSLMSEDHEPVYVPAKNRASGEIHELVLDPDEEEWSKIETMITILDNAVHDPKFDYKYLHCPPADSISGRYCPYRVVGMCEHQTNIPNITEAQVVQALSDYQEGKTLEKIGGERKLEAKEIMAAYLKNHNITKMKIGDKVPMITDENSRSCDYDMLEQEDLVLYKKVVKKTPYQKFQIR